MRLYRTATQHFCRMRELMNKKCRKELIQIIIAIGIDFSRSPLLAFVLFVAQALLPKRVRMMLNKQNVR